MQTIPLEDLILEPDRIRKTFVEIDIANLATSIQSKGLFHAILVQRDGKTVVAGERRSRALRSLYELEIPITYDGEEVPLGEVPIIGIGDLSPLDIREAELEENVIRVNYSWQEKSEAVRQLHELRTVQAEERGERQRLTDTAIEVDPLSNISTAITDISEDLLVSAYLEDEEIRKASTRKDAAKLIRKKLQKQKMEKLARDFDLDKLKTEHELIRGDLIEKLKDFEASTFDCIIADPPYGIDADQFKNQNAVKHTYKDDKEYSDLIITTIVEEGMRITKQKAHCYMFLDIGRFEDVKLIFQMAGWYVWKTPFIWYKGTTIGLLPRPNHGPRRSYEAILYAIKGNKETTMVASDVITVEHDRDVERGAHTPIGVYANLLARTCVPGDKVLDPCCGTGPIFPAASRNRVIATGIELEEAAFGQALSRIRGEDGSELEDF